MNKFVASALCLTFIAATPVLAESTVISTNGSRAYRTGPEANFTGAVEIEPLYAPNDTTGNSGSYVTFAPGARTAWHVHPGGQILIVTDGVGWFQEEGGPKREIKAGDVVWIPPGVKHWHGATATTGMRHIAITNMVGGKNVDWMQPVGDDEYAAPVAH